MKSLKILLTVLSLTALAACGNNGEDTKCTKGAMQCSGDILEECNDKGEWTALKDCSESGEVCHAEMGHCM